MKLLFISNIVRRIGNIMDYLIYYHCFFSKLFLRQALSSPPCFMNTIAINILNQSVKAFGSEIFFFFCIFVIYMLWREVPKISFCIQFPRFAATRFSFKFLLKATSLACRSLVVFSWSSTLIGPGDFLLSFTTSSKTEFPLF